MYKLKPSSMSKAQYDFEMQSFNSEEERAAVRIRQMAEKFLNLDEPIGEENV